MVPLSANACGKAAPETGSQLCHSTVGLPGPVLPPPCSSASHMLHSTCMRARCTGVRSCTPAHGVSRTPPAQCPGHTERQPVNPGSHAPSAMRAPPRLGARGSECPCQCPACVDLPRAAALSRGRLQGKCQIVSTKIARALPYPVGCQIALAASRQRKRRRADAGASSRSVVESADEARVSAGQGRRRSVHASPVQLSPVQSSPAHPVGPVSPV